MTRRESLWLDALASRVAEKVVARLREEGVLPSAVVARDELAWPHDEREKPSSDPTENRRNPAAPCDGALSSEEVAMAQKAVLSLRQKPKRSKGSKR